MRLGRRPRAPAPKISTGTEKHCYRYESKLLPAQKNIATATDFCLVPVLISTCSSPLKSLLQKKRSSR